MVQPYLYPSIVHQTLRARLPMKTGNDDHSDVQRPSQVEDQALVQQTETTRTEETFVTIETNGIANKPLEVPEPVPEGSDLNLAGTVKGVNLAVSPEDITLTRNTGGLEPHTEQMSGNHEKVGSYRRSYFDSLGNGKPMLCSTNFNKTMEFDPIKQHRHFCPWTVSTGKSVPGWLQTLSALEENKELSAHLV
ncbi:uncharacterized protein LOC121762869 [Salvia splendens]|uniref:uncharacterized protein LOC121762869 n=1 Tax=Salvia splendens TaxID=180675 RepID=UPI001C26B190|nr:uncharacterized protein LOC121762869 [Salvia splendens]XP_042014814.1 uncharacterized protein LOC121762869 [Salvia splendens]